MTVSFDGEFIKLIGNCPVEDAEPLLAHLPVGGQTVVDLSQSGVLHTAVVQVLLARKAKVMGTSGDMFVDTWLLGLLGGVSSVTN